MSKPTYLSAWNAARSIVHHWAAQMIPRRQWTSDPVQYWLGRLWICGEMFDDARATQAIEDALEALHIQLTDSVAAVLKHIKLMTATEYPPDEVNEVEHCFQGAGTLDESVAHSMYQEWTKKYPWMVGWRDVIRLGYVPGVRLR